MKNNLSILLVEDSAGDARLIKELLIDGGHLEPNFILTQTLEEAINLYKENNNKIDLILLDLGLPDSQGLDTFQKMQNVVVDTPIIVLTDLLDGNVAINCLKEGAQDYINKEHYDGVSLFRAITSAIERNQTERSLLEYALVLKSSNDAIYSKDLNGIVNLWNKGAERLFGYKAEEIIGQHVSILLPPDIKEDGMNLIHIIKEDREILDYEMYVLTKDGRRLNVLINAAPIKNKLGKIIGISVIAHDITYIKQNELILAIEYRIAMALSESPDINSAGHNILKIICEIQNWQIGEIWAVDQKQDALQHLSIWHSFKMSSLFDKNGRNIIFQYGEDLADYVWQGKRPIFINDLEQFEKKSKFSTLFPRDLCCCFGLPISFRGEVLGIILLFGYRGINIDRKLFNMFDNVSAQIGGFIKRKNLERNLLYLSEHDMLTGLSNRKHFSNCLNNEVARCRTEKLYFAILFIDLDFFKKINDSFGHETGDMLLKEVARRLSNTVRKTDIVARFGGDEFIILLTNLSRIDIDIITSIAVKILNLISKPFRIESYEFFITASIGISIYAKDSKNPAVLLRKADQAMYFAKNSGRNNFKFSYGMRSELTRKKYILENELHHAIEKNEMILHYQPIIDTSSSHTIGVEALIRWQHSSGVMISPADFIPLAIESNYIIELGKWILKTACSEFVNLHAKYLKSISVNIASPQLDKSFVQTVKEIIHETNIQPNQLVLELTEQVFISNTEANINIVRELKKLGVKIAIDDFGTGYSSFAYIKSFNIDIIKIDQSFIKDLPSDPNSIAIVNAIVAMAKAMHIRVIAEGVEIKEHYQFLTQHGCHYVQGFYISKPLPIEELSNFLIKKINF
ncbi:EAL domain-containing protein [Legionella sp. WA2022007384]